MKYIYKKIPLVGEIYLEYCSDNSPLWDNDWCCGEFFGCYWKVRLIYTPINRNRHGKNNDEGKGSDGPALKVIDTDRAVQRTRHRDADTDSCCFPVCCQIANAIKNERDRRRNWFSSIFNQQKRSSVEQVDKASGQRAGAA